MKRLLFWLRMIALAIPLMLLVVHYYAKPEVIKAADSVAEGIFALGGDLAAPVTVSQAQRLWQDIDMRVKALERSERRKDFLSRTFDTPAKAQTIIVCAVAALLLQVLSFAWDENRKKNERKA